MNKDLKKTRKEILKRRDEEIGVLKKLNNVLNKRSKTDKIILDMNKILQAL